LPEDALTREEIRAAIQILSARLKVS
jgi:hypothetical protein